MHASKPEQGRDVNPFQQLDQIVRKLRAPDGCPWDEKQTGPSLKKYLLEEAMELAEAIDNSDPEHIREEIGDMYFILALLALIYEEQDGVPGTDPVWKICDKMVRRHPHVFSRKEGMSGRSLSEEQLREQWERIKQEEKSTGKKK
ncbi:MAG: MazG nucleotide pyrophosphohydrolase domain-containing protein [Candidatus Electrothrix sp. Rat3]|nr:MazG nucleotide pyrophosphohydrolase domain-containing protein [Candidatus Electrothrix rattekaaiensis]